MKKTLFAALALCLCALLAWGASAEEGAYVLMNITYADFYAAEVTDASGLDAVASATLMKPRAGSLAGGITGYAGGFENPDFGVPVTAVRQCSTKNVTITAGADAEGVGDIVGSGFYNAQAAEMRGEPFDKPTVFVITDCKTE